MGFFRKLINIVRKRQILTIFISLFLWLSFSSPAIVAEECTSAVITGKVTADSRPLLWKNRDTDSKDNKIVLFTEGPLAALALITTGNLNSVWMGVNEAGLAIINTDSDDLEGTSSADNGVFMKKALLSCRSVADFEALLIQTNFLGRRTRSNYGVIDASGGAAYFEAGNHTFACFDPEVHGDTFPRILVRTNFAFTGDGSGSGHFRYQRAKELLAAPASTNRLTVEFILREVARDLVNCLAGRENPPSSQTISQVQNGIASLA
ncbi:MAG: carcinine hydrolase/isopenicillin-N N-acyltransferase family protein [Candidatus Aminicenantales bacterium]